MLKPAPLFALLLTAAVAVGAPVNYGAAIERQRARVTAEPTNAGARNDLGNLLVLVGDFAGAEAAYREAIAIEPKRAATHFNLGLLLQERGDHATAMLQFRKTIDLAPDHAWARYQMGVTYAHWHLKALAVRAYSQAIALDPRLGDPRYNPHLIANPLATQSMLRAYRRDLPQAQAPTVFDDASGVARMLIFDNPPKAEGSTTKPAPTAPAPPVAQVTGRGAGGARSVNPASLPAASGEEKPVPPVEGSDENAEGGGYLEVKEVGGERLPSAGVPALGVLTPGEGRGTEEEPSATIEAPTLPPTPVPVPTARPTPTPFAPGTTRPGAGFDPTPTSTGRMTTEVVPLGR